MSVSNNTNGAPAFKAPATMQDLLNKEDEAVRKAMADKQRKLAVISALPEHTPVPSNLALNAYCADQTLEFRLDAQSLAEQEFMSTLLALYPPVPLVDSKGSNQTQKPASCLTNEDRYNALLDIFPVVVKSNGTKGEQRARWWTQLEVGLTCVEVVGATFQGLKRAQERYAPDSHTYPTGSVSFLRRLPPFLRRPSTAATAWAQPWLSLLEELQLDGIDSKLVLMVANSTLQSGKAVPLEEMPTRLKQEVAQKVHELAQAQAASAGAVLAEQTNHLSMVDAWLRPFLLGFSGVCGSNDHVTCERLKHRAQLETGVRFNFGWLRGSGGRFSIRLYASRLFEGYTPAKGWGPYGGFVESPPFLDIEMPTAQRLPLLRPQDVHIDYE